MVGLLFRRLHLHTVASRQGTGQHLKRCCGHGIGSEARRLPSRSLGQGGLPTSLPQPCPLPKPASDAKPNTSSSPGLPGSPSDPTHITAIKGARFHCNVFPFPVPVHPHNKLPYENSFQASQEMAGSLMGFENCSCFWLCLLKHINQQGFFGKHPVSTCPPQHSQGPAQQSSLNGPWGSQVCCFLPFSHPGFRV